MTQAFYEELLCEVEVLFFGRKTGKKSGNPASGSCRIFYFPAKNLAIRQPAVAGYPAGYLASGIFFEKHPASGKKTRSGPTLVLSTLKVMSLYIKCHSQSKRIELMNMTSQNFQVFIQ